MFMEDDWSLCRKMRGGTCIPLVFIILLINTSLKGIYMAKSPSPLIQISKKLASLQAKSAKTNDEINALVSLVSAAMKKEAETAASVPAKAAPAKAVATSTKKPAIQPKATTPSTSLKKRGRPARK